MCQCCFGIDSEYKRDNSNRQPYVSIIQQNFCTFNINHINVNQNAPQWNLSCTTELIFSCAVYASHRMILGEKNIYSKKIHQAIFLKTHTHKEKNRKKSYTERRHNVHQS